jgi:spermidine synthase
VPGWVFPLLSLLFFCSGACALTYQVMWLRLLGLVFGVTVYAASTVLASFMGGLAIGSYLAGRLAGRLRSPLRAFGLIEIAIGVSALSTPLLLDSVKELWIAAQPGLPTSLVFLTGARFLVSFAVLIVPTTLMGATLPVVMRSALGTRVAAGASRMGLLYAINTTGAIIGALVAGFYLLSDVGVAGSFQLAATANVVLGLVAMAASARVHGLNLAAGGSNESPSTRATSKAHGNASGQHDLSDGQRIGVLWTFALSGVLSLALEIVWFRVLVMLLRPTAYAFTIMLAVVLAGIAAGSAIAAPWLRRGRHWLPVLTAAQLGIALLAVLSLNGLRRIEFFEEALLPALTAAGVDAYIGPLLISSALAMLPTTLLLGIAFPIGLALWTGRATDPSRRIGVFYSLNVAGAIVGSILGGFVLLPLLGSRGSVVAISALALVSSLVLAWSQRRSHPNFSGFIAIVGPVAFVMCALNAADPFDITAEREHRGEHVLWREEGVQTTVAVHAQGPGERAHRVMYLDGMHQASDVPQMVFVHQRIGALPALLHPDPTDALVVGLGGGATAGALAQYPGIAVDVVELSSAVVAGAAFFDHINFGLLKRPTVALRVDDGRNFLLTTRKQYDVVTADIILPRHAGAGALYSRDYFQLVRGALKPGGLVLQWNGGDAQTYRLIARTFLSVFPNTTLWADGTLMVGSVEPFTFSRAAFERRRADPRLRMPFDWDYDTLVGQYLGGPPEVAQWIGDGPILTDDRPMIEYFLSLPEDTAPLDRARLVGRREDIVRP